MSAHALVVGCDAYPHVPGGDLTDAVADARAVYAWLTGPGGVSSARATLLTSPERSRFAAEISRLIAEPDADRLYVYFAGHGCRTDPLNPALASDALAFSGFVGADPSAGTVGVDDLLRRLRLSRFREVVVVLDACRDFPFREPFQLGGIGRDPLHTVRRTPDLYLLQATQPGRPVRGGGLTRALLAGLAGQGEAKRYIEDSDPHYEVTWTSLVAYVHAHIPVGQDPHDEGAARDLLLARFPEGRFDPVELTVDVDPTTSAVSADLLVEVSHWDPSAPDDVRLRRPGPAPTRFTVPPRRQVVKATHGDDWGRMAVDVYADQRVMLPIQRRTPIAVDPDEVIRGVPPDLGALSIVANDPVAMIEVRTMPGRPVRAGIPPLAAELAEGQYLVMITDADGRERWEPLDVMAGYRTDLSLNLLRPRRAVRSTAWVGPAAALARASAGEPHLDEFVCVVNGPLPSLVVAHGEKGPVRLHSSGFGRRPVNSRTGTPSSGHRFVADQSTILLELRFGTHRLDIDAAPGLTVSVVFDDSRLWIAYFDSGLLQDPWSMLVLDRTQRLLTLGRRRAAQVVLGERLPDSIAARLVARSWESGDSYVARLPPNQDNRRDRTDDAIDEY